VVTAATPINYGKILQIDGIIKEYPVYTWAHNSAGRDADTGIGERLRFSFVAIIKKPVSSFSILSG
jgi:hypothetical protein